MKIETRLGLLAAVTLALPLPVGSQAASRRTLPSRIYLDATVTDASGRLVPELRASDFEIQWEGKPLEIAEFAYLRARIDAAQPLAQFHAVPWPTPFPSREEDGQLPMVFLIDDVSLTTEGRLQVRNAVANFIDTHVLPGELTAIVRTSGGTGIEQQLTSDRNLLHAALASLTTTPATASVGTALADALAGNAVGILTSVLDALRYMPGRKTVILFSENMQLFLSPLIPTTPLGARADAASVVFYAVDPRALRPSTRAQQSLNQISMSAAIGSLARDSGGVLFDQTNDAAGVIARVLQDRSGYYRLVCDSPEPAALVRNIKLRLKTAGLRLRVRQNFPGDTPAFPDRGGTPIQSLVPASPFAGDRIHVRATPLVAYSSASAFEILVSVDLRDLTFTRDLKGVNRAEVDLVTGGFGGDSLTAKRTQGYTIRFADEGFAAGREHGMMGRLTVPVSVPGPTQFHVVVRDVNSGRTGSHRQLIEVPDFKAGALLLSGIFLGTAASRPGEDAATRIFRPGSDIVYIYSVFNARTNTAKQVNLENQVRVTREGQEIYIGQPAQPATPDPDPQRRVRQGVIRLMPNARPGKYLLEITVTDKAGEAPFRSAGQSIDFEVR